MTVASSIGVTAIVDAHVHLYDNRANRYGIFEREDPGFEAFVGDYSALPRTYPIDDYLHATSSRKIDGIIWHEFIAEDPIEEVRWAQQLATSSEVPMALVGLVDFRDPDLPERLDIYRSFSNLTAVRQHLGWDEHNPLRRFAPRADLMKDPDWLRGLERLKGENLRCGLEVFASQLPDLLNVVGRYPDIAFTIAVLGWPLDLSSDGYARWRSDMSAISRCDNTCASISAVECIFGMNWSEQQVKPWIISLVELFGPKRCMFGSHMPIDALSYGFDRLYGTYENILAEFSDDERDDMLRRTALDWFRVQQRPSATLAR
jgi:predicted TIM-barrel fold metal-dependent hydrolase